MKNMLRKNGSFIQPSVWCVIYHIKMLGEKDDKTLKPF